MTAEFWLKGASIGDAERIADRIRPSDLIDIAAASCLPAKDALMRSFSRSHRRLALCWNTECVAVGGVEDAEVRGVASIWFIGTPKFDVALRAGGAKHCRDGLAVLAIGYDELFNFVPATNRQTLRWLLHLGFQMDSVPHPHEATGVPCLRVYLRPGVHSKNLQLGRHRSSF